MSAGVVHKIVGYDRATDEMVASLDIPPRLLAAVKKIVRVDADDPGAAWSYALDAEQARSVARLLGVPLKSDLDYFLEAFAAPKAKASRKPGKLATG